MTTPSEGGLTKLELQQLQATPDIAEHNRGVFDRNRRQTFVNCWTEGEESMAMWDLYAQSAGGVAVKSTVGSLKRAVSVAQATVHVAKIDYIDWQTAPWPNNLIAMHVRKAWGFMHENEVRLLTWLPASSVPTDKEGGALASLHNALLPCLSSLTASHRQTLSRFFNLCWDKASAERALPGLSINVELKDLIDEVIVGPRSDKWRGLVEAILRRYGLGEKGVRESGLTPSRDSVVA